MDLHIIVDYMSHNSARNGSTDGCQTKISSTVTDQGVSGPSQVLATQYRYLDSVIMTA